MSIASSSLTRIIIHGASGRMGSRLCDLAANDAHFSLIAAITRDDSSRLGKPPTPASTIALRAAKDFCDQTDVVIDFSSPGALQHAIDLAQRTRANLLVGTTGLSESSIQLLRDAARSRAVLLAPNTSLGVAVLNRLIAIASQALGPTFQASLVEAHHSAKKDAPSGTALRLAATARQAGANLPDHQVIAMRGGDVIGEHTLRFAGPGEYIELTHRATSRDLFVRGALQAARWLNGKAPGWYSMDDVLGIK